MVGRTKVPTEVHPRGQLLERGDDLAALDALGTAAGGGAGHLVLVEGPAGIGKTALVEAARELGVARGVAVLWARASELEGQFAYGVVRQLLEPALARLDGKARAAIFEGAARPASSVLGAKDQAEGDASFGILHGLYWVVLGLASHTPLILGVDDVQWADRPSLRFLVHLARRLEDTPVGLLLALRAGEPRVGDELLDELRLTHEARILRPAPLSEDAVVDAVRKELGAEADETFCRACHRASAGNPFYLRELLHAIDLDAIAPTREQVERVADVWPASIARHVLRRVARVGEGAPELAGALAVLGDGGHLRHAVALTGVKDAGALARALLEMGILSDEEPFRFSHPVVRGAVYADLTADRRERLHLHAARLLFDDGADAERVAAHLLAVAPARNAWCVEALRSAARQAIGRGAPENAVVYLRRALAEAPTAARGRVGLLRELGIAEEHSADAAAVEHLKQSWELCVDARERAEIALDLARTLETRGLEVDAVEVIRSALAERDAFAGCELEERLEAALISAAAVDARGVGPDVLEIYGRTLSDPPQGLAGQIALALAAAGAVWMGAPADGAMTLAAQALERGLLHSDQWDAIGACMWALILCERYDEVSGHLAELRDAVERRGHARGLALVLQLQANRAERLGLLAEAESSARLALDIAEARGLAVGSLSWIICSLVGALVERGDLAEAEAALDHMPAGQWPPHHGCMLTLAARGRLRLAQGRPDEALADLLDVGRQYQDWPGFALNGPAPSGWRSSAALALQRVNDLDEARRLASEELEAARVFGTPRPTAIALRAAGMVAVPDEALGLLHESVEVLGDSDARLEAARANTALGGALRRRGQRVAARGALREGLDLARRCGALPLAEFAHQELIAAGARPRREALSGLAALTASERRVADLAAEGLSNRQLAQTLYLSPKTVEMHLSRVYRKLDIPTRGELTSALTASGPA